jgi:hypothetical protein
MSKLFETIKTYSKYLIWGGIALVIIIPWSVERIALVYEYLVRYNGPDRGAVYVKNDATDPCCKSVVYTGDQGWDPRDSVWFYTTTQGSNLLPYDFFLELEQRDRPAMFKENENMVRYGYLPQKSTKNNPDGLPVGFVKDRYGKKEHLGFTCAACHTSQVNYKDMGIRIDGGPAGADMQTFVMELGAALKATLDDPKKKSTFIERVKARKMNYVSGEDDLIEGDLRKYSHRIALYEKINFSSTPYGYSRLDAFGRIYNRVLEHVLNSSDGAELQELLRDVIKDPKEREAILKKANDILGRPQRDHLVERFAEPGNLSDEQWDKLRKKIFHDADAPVSYPFLWDIAQHDYVQWNGLASNKGLGPVGRNTGEVIGVFGTLEWEKKSDLHPARHLVAGFTGQGFFQNPYFTFNSSVNLRNLRRIEEHLGKLRSPQWPRNIIPLPPDHRDRRARGMGLFNDYCSGCHAPIKRDDPNRRVIAHMSGLNDIKTDRAMAENSEARTGLIGILRNHRGFSDVSSKPINDQYAPISKILTSATGSVVATPEKDKGFLLRWGYWIYDLAAAFLKNKVTSGEEPKGIFDIDDKGNRRFLLSYKARPLNGIWATAPYLHNGSVPTLYDLLLPKQPPGSKSDGEYRPDEFLVGSREFDPEKVGFKYMDYIGQKFDTSKKGNSNAGHEYGASRLVLREDWSTFEGSSEECRRKAKVPCRVIEPLTREQRLDLLEYLKTFGDDDATYDSPGKQ